MYQYYGEGEGGSGGYRVSFSFSAITSSCELIAYDVRLGQTHYLNNDRYVIGDRSGEQPWGDFARWTRRLGVDLAIIMERMPRSAPHPLARERVWMEFRISRGPAFARVRWEEGSPRILCSIKDDEEEGGRWARSRPHPPGAPAVRRQQAQSHWALTATNASGGRFPAPRNQPGRVARRAIESIRAVGLSWRYVIFLLGRCDRYAPPQLYS